MAVIFRGLRRKLPVTIRTVGFGSEWSRGNLREQAALWLRLTARHWGAVVECDRSRIAMYILSQWRQWRAKKSRNMLAQIYHATPMRLPPIVHGSHECASRRHCDARSLCKVARQDGRWWMVGCEPRSDRTCSPALRSR